MMENISLDFNGLKISEKVIAETINTLFPGNNHIATLITILLFTLTGFISLCVFFYFSKRRRLWDNMKKSMKGWFSLSMGFFSFMGIFIIYFGFIILGIDFTNFFNGNFYALPLVILGGFVLYFDLFLASLEAKGRAVLMKTYRNLLFSSFLIPFTFLFFCISFINKNWISFGLFLIIDIIAFNYLLYPSLKKKK